MDNRSSELLSYIPCNISIKQGLGELRKTYLSAQPYPHIILDDLFSPETLDEVICELPPMSSSKWVHENTDFIVKYNLRSAVDLGQRSFDFVSILHCAGFLYFLSEITGVKALLPDPYLTGAGYHLFGPGGKFEVHADRNCDFNSGLERRIAMLIYLNKNWKSEFGGQLELWNLDGTRCEREIQPAFNRTLIFEIGDRNFHCVKPVSKASPAPRCSFAAYYHTAGREYPFHNSIYAPAVYQQKQNVLKRVAKQVLPPFLTRTFGRMAN